MVNYNDGNWHGWNGGECPVHPETTVHFINIHGYSEEGHVADDIYWGDPLLFRVIKEYKEAREFWINVKTGGMVEIKKYTLAPPDPASSGYIRVREVKP